jgi:hypothetical protein
MTNIIDDLMREALARGRAEELGRRIRELCEEFWDEDHDREAVVDALLRNAAGIIWDVEGEQPEMFIGLAAGVARRFWPDGQHGLKWNRAALKKILVKR